MRRWPASSHLVALGGCKLHVVPAGAEAGLALQKLSITDVNQFVHCKMQKKRFLLLFLSTLSLSASPGADGRDIKTGGTTAYSPTMVGGHDPGSSHFVRAIHSAGLGLGRATLCPKGSQQLPGTRSCKGFEERFESVRCASALAFHMVLQGSEGFKCLDGKFEHCSINKVCNKKDSLSLPCSCPPSRLSKSV